MHLAEKARKNLALLFIKDNKKPAEAGFPRGRLA